MLRFLALLIVFGAAFAVPASGAKKSPPSPTHDDAAAAPAEEGDSDAAKPGKVTGIYSTLKGVVAGDDMIGIEVIIVRGRDGLRALVQTADGVPGVPMLVPVRFDGSTVVFSIPSTTGELLEFRGKATRNGLTGTLDDRPLLLPRRRSFWQ